MRFAKTRVALLVCAAALIGLSGSAIARPGNQHHRGDAVTAAGSAHSSAIDDDHRNAFLRNEWKRRQGGTTLSARRHRAATAPIISVGSASGNDLVTEARKYLGTNPTGHKGGGNLAMGYAHYGRRVSGPQVGAIAVIKRRGGGHVGVVVGVDPNGNPIVVSGNHNRTVAQSVYPRSRIVAYVEPDK